MDELWNQWLEHMASELNTTSTLVTKSGNIALGCDTGDILVTSPMAMIGNVVGPVKPLKLHGHTAAITALYEWSAMGDSECECCGARDDAHVPDDSADDSDSDSDSTGCQACTHNLLVSAGKDLTIRIWDAVTGELLNTLPSQSAPVVQLCGILPTKQPVARHNTELHVVTEAYLKSHILAIGSDNSTTLISMNYLDRVHVTPPYHARVVRLTLRGDSGDLMLQYGDESRQYIDLSHIVGSMGDGSDQQPPHGRYPSFSISLVRGGQATAVSSLGPLGDSTAPGHWASVQQLASYGRGSAWGGRPSVLVMDFDITQLQALVTRLVPDGTAMSDVERILNKELCGQSDGRSALQPLNTSLMLLSALFTWGVSDELDRIKRKVFGMQPPRANISLAISNRQRDVHTVMFPHSWEHRRDSWCVSSLLNSQRMLAILVLARGALQ
ncbi:hypothetical protein FBU59_005860, partial [Linderina macrospora]